MLVTIVIPCYNVAPYVADALESALSQDYPHLEIIAVDNNSTDNTWDILNDYANRYPERIKLLKQPQQGAPAARNMGWKAGKGAWVQFLDADDMLLPGKITRQMGLVSQCPTCGMVAGTPIYQSIDGTSLVPPPHPDPWIGLMHGMKLGNTVVNLWSRKILEQVGGWDESLPDAQDPFLMFAFLKVNDIVVTDETPSAICREREDGSHISMQNVLGRFNRQLVLRREMLFFIQQTYPSRYRAHRKIYLSLTIRLLRLYATESYKEAAAWSKLLIPSFFIPVSNATTELPAIYVYLYPVFGFSMLEKWRLWVGRTLPPKILSNIKTYLRWERKPLKTNLPKTE